MEVRHVSRLRGRGDGSGLLAVALVLSTLTGCSNYIGTTAASFLRRVKEDPDPNVRYLAYAKLGSPNCYDSAEQKQEAVRTLIEKLGRGREPVASRAVICHTLGELRDPAAREIILKMVNDPEPVVRIEACRALGKVGKPEDATVLARLMTVDTLEDCRIASIEALGELKPADQRINQVLVAALRSDDPATRFASVNALRKITGQDAGVDADAWNRVVVGAPSETLVAAGSEKATDAPQAPPASQPNVASAPDHAPRVASYPPRPTPIPDPPIDSSTRPVGYPPAPRPYGGRR